MSRTENAIRNIKFTIFGQVLSLIMNFIGRTLFVYYLGAEYLGINGLFSNILSILSLAELGVGTAIVYSLYEPLATGDRSRVNALMRLFKRAYTIIGISILLFGMMLLPFLDFFIKEIPDISSISLIYFLFVFNTAVSYFFSYKRALIIADQKKYIDSLYHYTSFLIMNIVQIVVLLVMKDYLVYLVVKVITTILENYFISRKANSMYPYLSNNKESELNQHDKIAIRRNIGAMFFHRLGSVIVDGTDNLLISKFIGIVTVGIYSNYLLIITTLQTIYNMTFQSLIASIGNLGVLADRVHIRERFNTVNLVGFWIYSFSTISLFILLNPFITLWLGANYIFPIEIVLMICINFYIKGQRMSVLTFRDALGLFWYDRFKPIAESIINLVVSVVLALNFGVIGVFIGTTISTVTTALWVEPYILYKYGFKEPSTSYFWNYLKQIIITLGLGILTNIVASLGNDGNLLSFIYKVIICFVMPNMSLYIIYRKTFEFNQILEIFNRKFR